ncbi:VOC family protein [Nocardia blacklockiae]|uniref:VOC family protein n=1 Tax=Nocardia blacklockiae TaxID=480036 RepID=UPI0018956429|nr:VOC family protein [Nocardia blacklockiae]MBF6170560.1 glyoxalase [Nocardia blacklockiae]
MTATSIPMLWSGDLAVTLEFYRALGYAVTHEQTRPYSYGVIERDGCQVHFGPMPEHGGSAEEARVGCLVLIDDAARWHAEFTECLRRTYGRVPARGAPRITRFRPGQTRFTVVDPAGNSITYIQRDEPEVEYGGSRALTGLARVLDNARILRDFKTDEAAAVKVVEVGLRRFARIASALERGRALAMLADIHTVAGDSEAAARRQAELAELTLTAEEKAALRAEYPGVPLPGE